MSKRKRFGISKHLSESLSQTISAVVNNAGTMRFEVVPLNRIELDPDNPRELSLTVTDVIEGLSQDDLEYKQKRKERDSLQSLAFTISQKGVLNPIWIYKVGTRYRVAAGERRVLASLMAGRVDVPAKVLEAEPNTPDLRFIQWVENIEREDLSLWEKLNNLKMMIKAAKEQDSQIKINATYLKNLLGCSLPHAMNYFAALNADEQTTHALRAGVIASLEKAAAIANISNSSLRADAIEACHDGRSLKHIQAIAASYKPKATKVTPVSFTSMKRGRKATKVNLGSTRDKEVAKVILESILARDDFKMYQNELGLIDWQDYTSVTNSFKKLIRLLEQRQVELLV